MNIHVDGGTGAGRRPPYSDGHAPRCQCSRCGVARLEAELAAALASCPEPPAILSMRPDAVKVDLHDVHVAWASMHEQRFGPRTGWDAAR